MKRLVCAISALALLFVLAACSMGSYRSSGHTSGTSRNQTSGSSSRVETVQAETIQTALQEEAVPSGTRGSGYSITYIAGIAALIIASSTGLLILRRI